MKYSRSVGSSLNSSSNDSSSNDSSSNDSSSNNSSLNLFNSRLNSFSSRRFSSKKFSSFVLLFALILIFSIIASAKTSAVIDVNTNANNDFVILSGSSTFNVCACGSSNDFITIQNTGSFPAGFYISSNSDFSNKITLSDKYIELNPGDSRNVYIYVDAQCSPKNDDITINVKSSYGIQKSITKNIQSSRCQNVALWVYEDGKAIEPCSSSGAFQNSNSSQNSTSFQNSTFTIFVKNLGTFQDNYYLSSNYDSNIKYTSSYFSLLPNQIAQISAYANFDCSVYGDKNITFNARSEKNGLEASTDATLKIQRDYDYGVEINWNTNTTGTQYLGICNRIWQQVPVTITNHGIENTFYVDTNNFPKFVSLGLINDNKFTLKENESKTFYLYINTQDFRYENKDYVMKLIFTELYGDISNTATIDMNTKSCFEHSIEIMNKQGSKQGSENSNAANSDNSDTSNSNSNSNSNSKDENSKNNPLKTCSGYLYDRDVILTNKGIFTENISLDVTGVSSGFDLSKTNVQLPSGNSTNLKLYAIGPETNDLFNVIITAKLSNGLSEQDGIWIKSYDQNSCHYIAISKNDFNINYDDRSISLKLINEGIVDGRYSVSIDGMKEISESNEISENNGTSGINEMSETHLILLNSSYSKLYISKTSELILPINSQSSQGRIAEGKYSVNLTITHIDSGESYVYPITVTLKDKSQIRKYFESFIFGNVCRQFSLYEIIAILIAVLLMIAFMIWGPHYNYKFWNRVRLKIPVLIILITLFLVGFVLVVVLSGFPKTNTQIYNLTTNVSELRFEWLQNDKYTLDVGQFFYDADNNTVNYNVSPIKNVKTTVNGKYATFYPDLDWSGTRNFEVTAYDKFGGSANSPNMTLSVLNVPKKSIAELYSIYCWYTNLAIFAILLIFVFLIFIVKQKRRTRK